MTTIINNPGNGEVNREERGEGSNVALMIVLLILVIGGILFYMYGLPENDNGDEVNVTVPETVDVNVQTPDFNTDADGEGAGSGNSSGGAQ